MNTEDVIRHYKTRAAIARALNISRAAVSKWGDIVPESSAYKLQFITRGAVKVKPEHYQSGAQTLVAEIEDSDSFGESHGVSINQRR